MEIKKFNQAFELVKQKEGLRISIDGVIGQLETLSYIDEPFLTVIDDCIIRIKEKFAAYSKDIDKQIEAI